MLVVIVVVVVAVVVLVVVVVEVEVADDDVKMIMMMMMMMMMIPVYPMSLKNVTIIQLRVHVPLFHKGAVLMVTENDIFMGSVLLYKIKG